MNRLTLEHVCSMRFARISYLLRVLWLSSEWGQRWAAAPRVTARLMPPAIQQQRPSPFLSKA